MANHAAVGGFLDSHVDHHVPSGDGPGHFDLRVGPAVAGTFLLDQAHFRASVNPLAGACHVILQCGDVLHVGLDIDDTAIGLVLGTGDAAQVDLDAILVLGQLPVVRHCGSGKPEDGGCHQGHSQNATHVGIPLVMVFRSWARDRIFAHSVTLIGFSVRATQVWPH
ncbi:hypothetical protein FQZ97_956350 [compost metagenome]